MAEKSASLGKRRGGGVVRTQGPPPAHGTPLEMDEIIKKKPCSITMIDQYYRRRSGVFIVNFEHISHLVLVFLLLTLNMELPAR